MVWLILIGWLIVVLVFVAWNRREPKDYANSFTDCVLIMYGLPVAILFYIIGYWSALFLDFFKQGMKSHES